MHHKRFDPKRLREARGKRSVEEMAVALSVSFNTIRNWEAGRSEPDASALAHLAAVTRRRLDYFFAQVA